MTRDDIIRLAKEAGLTQEPFCRWGGYLDDLMRFTALVAAEKEQQMTRDGWRQCAKGQRTTQFCKLLDAAVKAEREACAKVCDELRDEDGFEPYGTECAAAIRARGEV